MIVIGLFLIQVCDVFSSEITCLCDEEGEVLKCFLTSEALMVEDINMAGDQISLHHQDPLHPRQNTVNTGNFLAIFKHFSHDEGEIFFIFISIVGQKKQSKKVLCLVFCNKLVDTTTEILLCATIFILIILLSTWW